MLSKFWYGFCSYIVAIDTYPPMLQYICCSVCISVFLHIEKFWLQPNLTSSATLGWTLTQLLAQINMERLTPGRLSRKLAAWHAPRAAKWLVWPLPQEPLRSCSKKHASMWPATHQPLVWSLTSHKWDAWAPLHGHRRQLCSSSTCPPTAACGATARSHGNQSCRLSLAALPSSVSPLCPPGRRNKNTEELVVWCWSIWSSWVKPRTWLGLDCKNYKFAIWVI
jgi:hypothetical protein